ncbi:MAG: M16 family metallopeptidase [Burkholderiaceae bacterium]
MTTLPSSRLRLRGAVALLLSCGFLAACAVSGPDATQTGSVPNQASASVGRPATSATGVVEHQLPNGMKVLVKRDGRAPTVAHMVWYRAGSMDEVNGRTGVAHVLEHMMFKGTRDLGPGEFSKRVAAMGGRENAFTSRDYTGYFQQVHRSRLADVMALEADRMAHLRLSADEFAKEIKVVMEERRMRTDDRARGLVFEQLMATAFVAHPYRAPIIGWMSDLESLTVEDAQQWYDTWYSPSNAVLVVTGDVQPDEVIALASRTYGKVPSRALPARKPQGEPEQRGMRRIEVKAPADTPYVVMAWKVPGLRDVKTDREAYALEVLSSLLSSGDSTRLVKNIVRGSRTANQASAGYDLLQRGPALFIMDGTPAQGKSTVDVESALRAELARIANEDIPQRELERVKVQYVADRIYKRDSIFAQAMELAGLEMVGLGHADADRILEQVRSVTADEVRAVAKKYFSDDQLTVATLLPQPIDPKKPARAPAAGARH